MLLENRREQGFAYIEQLFFSRENSTGENKAIIGKLLNVLKNKMFSWSAFGDSFKTKSIPQRLHS